MLEDVITSYDAAYHAMEGKLSFNTTSRLSAMLDYLLNDIYDPATRRLFFGFWALSCHNRFVATLMHQAYAYHRDKTAAFVGAVRADLSDEECQLVAAQVAALIEGSMIPTAPRTKLVPRDKFIPALKGRVEALISEWGAPAKSSARRRRRARAR